MFLLAKFEAEFYANLLFLHISNFSTNTTSKKMNRKNTHAHKAQCSLADWFTKVTACDN